MRKRGFNRLYQNGQIFEFSTPESLLDLNFCRTRFHSGRSHLLSRPIRVPASWMPSRSLSRSRRSYFRDGARRRGSSRDDLRFSPALRMQELRHHATSEPEPRLFSFNNPYGACPRCQGFGNTIDFDLDLVIPDKSKTLNEGAIEPWTKPKYRPLFTELKRFARQADDSRSTCRGSI